MTSLRYKYVTWLIERAVQAGIAQVMLPVLQRELAHLSSQAVFRARRLDVREICGTCIEVSLLL